MKKQTVEKQKTRKINYFQLSLAIILNILVIIVALIIYHEVFREPKRIIESYMDITPAAEGGKILP